MQQLQSATSSACSVNQKLLLEEATDLQHDSCYALRCADVGDAAVLLLALLLRSWKHVLHAAGSSSSCCTTTAAATAASDAALAATELVSMISTVSANTWQQWRL
eukprot:19593-Heterococcus_DN1.PRE.2